MGSAPVLKREAEPANLESVGDLKAILEYDLRSKTDEEIAALQKVINVATTRLLNALSSPFTVHVEDFLVEMQKVTAANPVPMSECTRSRAFYFGQIYALAELAGTVRHMKVPKEVAEVALNRSDSGPIMRLAVEHDAITKTKLASAMGKASQNLHAVLQEMEECGLIRRDELGRTVVYSPTPLTRVCLNWMERTKAAAG